MKHLKLLAQLMVPVALMGASVMLTTLLPKAYQETMEIACIPIWVACTVVAFKILWDSE